MQHAPHSLVTRAAVAAAVAAGVGIPLLGLAGRASIHSRTVINHSAEASPAASPTTSPRPSPKQRPAIDLVCMQAATEKRDNAIIAAVDTHHAAIRTALETRRNALKNAWAITDKKQRRAALVSAWQVYRKSQREAAQAFRKSRQTVWGQFRKDRKSCGKGTGVEDHGNEAAEIGISGG